MLHNANEISINSRTDRPNTPMSPGEGLTSALQGLSADTPALRLERQAACAEEMAVLGHKMGVMDAHFGGVPRGVLAAQALAYKRLDACSVDPQFREQCFETYVLAYRKARLNTVEEVLEGLAQKKGAIIGRRKIDHGKLQQINQKLDEYIEKQHDLLEANSKIRNAIDGIIITNQAIGVQKCLSADVIASKLWNHLVGSVASKPWVSKISILVARPDRVIEALQDLSLQERQLVRDVFFERFGIGLVDLIQRVCPEGIRGYVIDHLSANKVAIASSGISFLLSQPQKFRNGTRILQEFKRLLANLNPTEIDEFQTRFRQQEAKKLGALNILDAGESRLSPENFQVLKAFVMGDGNLALAHLLKRLLTSPPKQRRETCDFLSELPLEDRKAMSAKYGENILIDINTYLGHNTGLRDLAEALLAGDEGAEEVARLWLSLHGDNEEWPGEPFLGKNAATGAELISRYNKKHGDQAFETRLSAYKGAEIHLIRALIGNEVAPACEIYFACVAGIGCDLDSLKLLVRSSSAEEISNDAKAFQKLWSERLTPLGKFVAKIAAKVLPLVEERFGEESTFVRTLGVATGRLKDVLWFESMGDHWVDMKVDLGGKTDDPTRLLIRACKATEHELSLPVTKLMELKVFRDLLPHDFDARKLSREAKALLDDYSSLHECYAELFATESVHPDDLAHFKAMVDRLHVDRHSFRLRKRYVSQYIASTVAGVSTTTLGSLLLFTAQLPILTVLPITIVSDFLARCGVKAVLKGRSRTWEELANDVVHSIVNGGTLYLRGVSKAFVALRRILTNPLVERGADFAGKFLGKFTFGTLIRYMLYRKTANHTITPDELKRGMFVESERKRLGELF